MSAYIIVDTKINDPDAYEKYKALARPLVEKHGGIYRARGGDMDVVQSELWSPTRVVLLEFADMQSARDFLDCDDYAPVKSIRYANAECTTVIIDGV